MKKIIFTVLIFQLSFVIVSAQWYQQYSGVSGNLYDVKFINKNTGWAVGENGIIIKTTNSGSNWINVSNPISNTGKIISSICVIDSNIFYFVGTHSTYIKTTNGGSNWIVIRNGPYGSGMGFEAVYFLNKDTGWACGNMRVLRTTNGGLTFDSAGIFWGSLHDIYFKDFNTGVICGDGVVFKTTDGGLNWFNSNVPTQGHYPMFMRFGIAENNYVWVSGQNSSGVYRSTNFATTWIKIDSVQIGAYGLYFINKDTGFGGGGANMLFKTTNSGFNWHQENTGIGVLAFISDIYFFNDSLGWYVGGAGKIFHTTTGGQPLGINAINNGKIPGEYELFQNYPNPFNSQTNIEFDISESGTYIIEIFDLLGRKKDELFNKHLNSGRYRIKYDADNLTSGMYFYRLKSEKISKTKTFILIK